MTLFLKFLFFAGCLGALAAALVVGYIFLFESGGGNWIGGLAVAAMLTIGGGALVAFYLLGLVGAWGLRARQEPLYMHWFGRFSAGLLALALAVLMGRAIKEGLKDYGARRDREAWDKTVALVDSILSDPAKLQDYAARQGLESPLPGNSQTTPLEGAVQKGYKDLVEKFLSQGARVTDNALTAAVQQGSAETLSLLLSHAKITDDNATVDAREGPSASISFMSNFKGPTLSGTQALQAAYDLGNEEMLRFLVLNGVQTNRLAMQLTGYGKFLGFFPGDVDGKALLQKWADKDSNPAIILSNLETARNQAGSTPANEDKLAADALNFSLQYDQIYADPKVRFKQLKIEPWMKEVPSYGWNNSPLIRRINRAILEALYPGAIPAPSKGKGFSMYRLLVKNVQNKTGEGGKRLLRTAVSDRDVELVEFLLGEGFTLQTIADELHSSSFLDVPADRHMKSYLLGKGILLKGGS